MRKAVPIIAGLLLACTPAKSQIVVDFEDTYLNSQSYLNGFSNTLGTFTTDLVIGNTIFHNTYSRSDWGYGLSESFSGFAYSKVTDHTTPGYGNQYSCIAGSGMDGSMTYGVFYASAAQRVDFSEPSALSSIALCNSTYAFLSMKDGDAFGKKFGGASGDEPDFFFVRIVGISSGNRIDSTDFYLADFRFEDNSQDYLINSWTAVDLSSFGQVDALEFSLQSSDNGDWGMNTPAYFCVDNLNGIDFENQSYTSGNYWNGSTAALQSYDGYFTSGPARFSQRYSLSDWGYGMTGSFTGWALSNVVDTETAGFTNQYAAIPGSGATVSANYALCYNSRGSDTIRFENPLYAVSLDLTNGTYPYLSMRDGDAFAKQFGGESGDDPDYFMVTISGYLDGELAGIVEFYLADFRFEDHTQDYILNEWSTAELGALGQIDMLTFSLSSSDNGDWGMNTPAYFFIDNLVMNQTSSGNRFTQNQPVNMYPNPAIDQVNIESNQPIERLTVYSLGGQQLYDRATDRSESRSSIDVSTFRKGHYIIRIHTSDQIITKKLIKN